MKTIAVVLLCGWVLWNYVSNFRAKDSLTTEEWKILKAYESLSECRKDEATVHNNLKGSAEISAKLSGGSTFTPGLGEWREVIRGRDGETVGIRVERGLCLPGTLDPRSRFKE